MNRHEMYKKVRATVEHYITHEREEVPATIFFARGDGELLFQPAMEFMGGEVTKTLLVHMMRQVIQDEDIQATVFVSESWMSRIAKDGPKRPYVRPSEDPERVEMISLTCEDADGLEVHSFEIAPDRSALTPLDIGDAQEAAEVHTRFVWFPGNIERYEIDEDLMEAFEEQMGKRVKPTSGGSLHA